MRIAIIGGNGFIGKYLVARLHKKHDISIFTRQSKLDRAFENIPNITSFNKQTYSKNELKQYLHDYDAVINLIGILNERGHKGLGFYTAHVDTTEHIIEACLANGITRYLHMSALGADAHNGASHYQRTKGIAEDFVHAQHSHSFAVTSFRPSVIFGAGDSFCNRFAQLIKIVPFIMPLACAHTRFAPVYAGDVADAFVSSLLDTNNFNQRIDLCGPDIVTLQQIVQLTAETLNKRRLIIPLPHSIAYAQALCMDYCIPGKPFSIDNFNSLQVDNICTCTEYKPRNTTLTDTINTYVHLPTTEQERLILS